MREGSLPPPHSKIMKGAGDAARFLAPLLADQAQECLAVLLLDNRHRPLGVVEVARGNVNMVHVQPRDVFTPALVSGAQAVIVAHNHPSGDPTPSPDDRHLTESLVDAGTLLGVQMLDHLVIGHGRACTASPGSQGSTPFRLGERAVQWTGLDR